MSPFRIALANLRAPASGEESIALAEAAIIEASRAGADLVAFPECFVPDYRFAGKPAPAPDAGFLERAWSRLAAATARAGITAAIGTERIVDGGLRISVLVIDSSGTLAGFQDKVQLDPSEESIYTAGSGRRVFEANGHAGRLIFGVAICHEGWRYPETVRWAVRHGAQLVLHPHIGVAEPGGYVPSTFGDPANTFHEKALLVRAAENTCYVASINIASPHSPTTSAVARPDGTLLASQPYGVDGLLIADLDLSAATGLLASRLRVDEYRD